MDVNEELKYLGKFKKKEIGRGGGGRVWGSGWMCENFVKIKKKKNWGEGGGSGWGGGGWGGQGIC